MRRLLSIFWLCLPAALCLVAWQWMTSGNQRLLFLFSSPEAVWDVGTAQLASAALWHDILVTFSEAGLGLLFGTIAGTACGLLLWGNGKIDFVTRPYIIFLGSIPIFALAPMTIIWFGIGLLSKTVMAGFAVFFVSLIQAYEGAHAIAGQHLEFARSLNAANRLIVRKIVIPGAIDWVMAGYKMNVGSALIGSFIGEFVSSEAGLGHFILKASALYDVPRVLLGVFLISLLGLAMTGLASLIRPKGYRRSASPSA